MKRRVALFGGSFDPPHVGHAMVMTYVLQTAEVDALWMIPAFEHALGKSYEASFDQRFEMCSAVTQGHPLIEVSTIERELGGVSRTLLTVQALAKLEPDVEFRLVMGSDLLGQVHRWYRWEELRELAPPLVVGRTGHTDEESDQLLAIPEVSSTEIRRRLAAQADVSTMVPRAVRSIIQRDGLYGSSSSSPE